MAEHPVEEDIETTLVRPVHQFFKLGVAAEVGVHVEKITGEVAGGVQPVVAALTGAGVEHRSQPDGVDVEALDMVQAVDDPLQIAVVLGGAIADAVVGSPVTIHERLHHHLIDAQVAGWLIIPVTGATGRYHGRMGNRRIDDRCASLPARRAAATTGRK